MTYLARHEEVARRAWFVWTDDGADLDAAQHDATVLTARYHAHGAYDRGQTADQWLEATLAKLKCDPRRASSKPQIPELEPF